MSSIAKLSMQERALAPGRRARKTGGRLYPSPPTLAKRNLEVFDQHDPPTLFPPCRESLHRGKR